MAARVPRSRISAAASRTDASMPIVTTGWRIQRSTGTVTIQAGGL